MDITFEYENQTKMIVDIFLMLFCLSSIIICMIKFGSDTDSSNREQSDDESYDDSYDQSDDDQSEEDESDELQTKITDYFNHVKQ